MLPDFAKYIGLPFADRGRTRAGVDCWGLVRLVYMEQLAIALPDYSGWYTGCDDEGGLRVARAGEEPFWRPVAAPGEIWDVILLREEGWPLHVGLVVAPGRMLHARRGIDSCVEDFTRPKWAPRIAGFYRYAGRD